MSLNPPKPPIHRFHEFHSNGVMMYHNWTTARRIETKGDNGVVFTSNPIKPNEKLTIKLVEVSDKLPATISIGFTSKNPSTLRYDLLNCPNNELKRKPGFWICSLSSHICLKNKTVFFYFTTSGSIHYGMDGVEKGRFARKLDATGDLWGVINIWSTPTAVQVLNQSDKMLTLHQQTFRNVQLTQRTAQKVDKRLAGYAFTSRPLRFNEHVLVEILHEGSLTLGVTSCDPALLRPKDLPDNPDSLLDRPEYWIVVNDPTWSFKPKEEISFVITKQGVMKIWRNSSLLLKVIHVDYTLKLWGFFEVGTAQGMAVKSTLLKVPTTSSTPTLSQPEPPMSNPTQSAVRQGKEADCVVCCENVIEAALYPCGHMCMCYNCARKQWRSGRDGHCPMCRAVIKDVLKIYKTQ